MSTNLSHGGPGRRPVPATSVRGRIAVLALALLMLLPSGAAAELAAAASTNPSIDQYVETVPSADGDRRPQTEPGSRGGSVPSDVRRRIREDGGSDARQLQTIVSSPALGAPESGGSGKAGRRDGRSASRDGRSASGDGSGSVAGDADAPSAIEAVVTAGGHGDGSSYGWLLAGILVLSAGMAAAALARRRSGPRSP